MNSKKTISIITPCFNEEGSVRRCIESIRDLFQGELAKYDYEHILCDNASTDRTLEILRAIAGTDQHVKVIVNSRNFGPVRSCFNGILAASGDAAVLFFPADLQDPPDVIPRFVELWEQGYQVVRGLRAERQENFVMRNLRHYYYRMLERLANVYLPPDSGEFQLVDRCVLHVLRQCDDYYPYIRGLAASCGFSATEVPYRWARRTKGISKTNWYMLIDIGLNGLISFSNVPLRLCLLMGFFISCCSILYAFIDVLIVLGAALFFGKSVSPPGIPTLIAAIFFFSGVQLFFLGVLGEYTSAIHSQVRKRPLVIERERINFPNQPPTYPGNLSGLVEAPSAELGVKIEV